MKRPLAFLAVAALLGSAFVACAWLWTQLNPAPAAQVLIADETGSVLASVTLAPDGSQARIRSALLQAHAERTQSQSAQRRQPEQTSPQPHVLFAVVAFSPTQPRAVYRARSIDDLLQSAATLDAAHLSPIFRLTFTGDGATAAWEVAESPVSDWSNSRPIVSTTSRLTTPDAPKSAEPAAATTQPGAAIASEPPTAMRKVLSVDELAARLADTAQTLAKPPS